MKKEEKILLVTEDNKFFIIHELAFDCRMHEKVKDEITQNFLCQNQQAPLLINVSEEKCLKFRKFQVKNPSVTTIYNYVKNNENISECHIKEIFNNILKMVFSQVIKGYIVSNLRLESTLYDEEQNRIYIIDMEIFQQEYKCNFAPYFAPEMGNIFNIDSESLLSWQMGNILYFLAFSHYAFQDITECCNKSIRHDESIKNSPRSDSLKQCIIGLLTKNKSERLKISEIYDTELFQY